MVSRASKTARRELRTQIYREQHAGEIGIDLVKNINWMLFFASCFRFLAAFTLYMPSPTTNA